MATRFSAWYNCGRVGALASHAGTASAKQHSQTAPLPFTRSTGAETAKEPKAAPRSMSPLTATIRGTRVDGTTSPLGAGTIIGASHGMRAGTKDSGASSPL